MDGQSSTPAPTSPPDSSKTTMFVVIAGVVLVLLAVGMFMWRLNAENSTPAIIAPVVTSTPTPTPEAVKENPEAMVASVAATVTFNGKTYSPSTVTIKKGQTVKFVNTSSVNMAVASAPHPTHTDYPEFDQTKDLTQQGKTEYTFTFTKIGSWKYHNHSPFMAGGTVVVTQ